MVGHGICTAYGGELASITFVLLWLDSCCMDIGAHRYTHLLEPNTGVSFSLAMQHNVLIFTLVKCKLTK